MANQPAPAANRKREHLGIHFRCCHIYGYIYKNRSGTAYSGWCPKCMRKIEVKIGKSGGGTDQRIFQTNF